MGLHTTNPPPTSPTHGPNRYKTLPATAAPWPDRYKTLPARPKTPKSGHFSRAGRISSRFQHQSTTHPVQNSPSNTHPRAQPVQNSPSNTHPLAQPVQNSPDTPTINEIRPFQARRENFLPLPTPRHRAGRISSRFQHQSTTHPVQNSPSNSRPLAQPVQNSPSTPKNTEIRPFQARRENFFPVPPPIHHSPGKKLSPHAHARARPVQNSPRNTHPRAQPVQNSPRNTHLKAQPVQNSPRTPTHGPDRYKTRHATPTSRPNRYKTLPATAAPGPNRYKTLPARPKTPKSGHFKRAGRIFSRFNHHATEQGELSPASTTTPPLTRYKTLTATPTPRLNRYKTLPARPQSTKSGHFKHAGRAFSRFQHQSTTHPVQNSPSNTHPLAQPVQNSPRTPKNTEIRPFLASRENFLPVPPPRHRAGRISSRFQHHLGAYFNAADRLVPTFTRAPDQCAPELGIVRVIGCSSRCSSRTRRD